LKGLKIANKGVLHGVIDGLADLIFPSGLLFSPELNFSHRAFLVTVGIGLRDH
jgi:hypothetical protein